VPGPLSFKPIASPGRFNLHSPPRVGWEPGRTACAPVPFRRGTGSFPPPPRSRARESFQTPRLAEPLDDVGDGQQHSGPDTAAVPRPFSSSPSPLPADTTITAPPRRHPRAGMGRDSHGPPASRHGECRGAGPYSPPSSPADTPPATGGNFLTIRIRQLSYVSVNLPGMPARIAAGASGGEG
jgi:hypothetical protein